MTLARKVNDAIATRLPADKRRRLGRIKRAILDHPEPARSAKRRARATATARAPQGMSRLDVRRSHIFATASPAASILEIGPAHNGTLPRRDGFDTRNLDYLDREGLVAKYANFEQYNPDDIEDVDYVLDAGVGFSAAIPDRFDIVLASHVLEHTTSLVDFINECAALLQPGGQLAMIVPDHRFCFDRFRERSSIARVIDAHLDPVKVHTVGTLADFSLNAVQHRGAGSWAPGHQGRYAFAHPHEAVGANMKRARGTEYIDVHNWIFSPNHLRLLLQDLADLNFIALREAHFHVTVGHEFFINLSASGNGTGMTRQQLLRRADSEKRTLDSPVFE